MKFAWKKTLFTLIIGAGIAAAGLAYAQTGGPLTGDRAFGGDTGITAEDLAGTAGLSTLDPRIIISRVINVALGFLGIIAVGFIIYAGFLWMTSQGNPEQIQKAKKILTGAVIGLVIVLSSFAIAAFVMRVLGDATGGGGSGPQPCDTPGATEVCTVGSCAGVRTCQDNGLWSGCEDLICSDDDQFILQSIQPANMQCEDGVPDNETVRNTVIKINFSSPVQTNPTASGGVELGNTVKLFARPSNATDMCASADVELTANDVNLTFTNGDRTILLRSTQACPANSCASSTCFSADEHYRIWIDDLVGANGEAMTVSSALPYTSNQPVESEFFTNDVVDCEPPQATMSDPGPLCANDSAQLSASATDNDVVDYLELRVDGTYETHVDGGSASSLSILNHPWTPASGSEGTNVTLSAYAYDRAMNEDEDSLSKTIYTTSCCNGVLDGEEEQIDCGGPDCPACSDVSPIIDYVSPQTGECSYDGVAGFDQLDTSIQNQYNGVVCVQDSQCAFSHDDTTYRGSCADMAPNGAAGNMVTIGGRYFGEYDQNTSKVQFTGANGWVDADLAGTNTDTNVDACGLTWSNDEIIVLVPSGADSGPIRVEREVMVDGSAETRFDVTDSGAGPAILPFEKNSITRPGICKLDPEQDLTVGGTFTVYGNNFGTSPPNPERNVRFGDPLTEETFAVTESSALTWGLETIRDATVPNLQSRDTTVFVTLNPDNFNRASNVKRVTIAQPESALAIHRIQPPAGHPGDYITITGTGFGSERGTVQFGSANADTSFPDACGPARHRWQDDQILVKVPEGVSANNPVDVTVTLSDTTTSETVTGAFVVGDYCSAESDNAYTACPNGASDCNGSDAACIETATPGLCLLQPDNGPIDKEVQLIGERFGPDSTGNNDAVTFHNNVDASVNSDDWSVTTIDTNVPTGAQTGDVTVTNNSNESNPLSFNVGSCLDNGGDDYCDGLTAGSVCCAANTQLAGSCAANQDECGAIEGSGYSQYYVEFSTAIDGGGNDGTGPRVVEECARDLNSCQDRPLPSPAPLTPWDQQGTPYGDNWDTTTWTESNDKLACVNATVTFRLDQPVDRDILTAVGDNPTVTVQECGDDPESCSGDFVTHYTSDDGNDRNDDVAVSFSNSETNVIFTPENNLAPGTWYEVRLRGGTDGIREAQNDTPLVGNEGDDYVWHFKTKDDPTPCGLSCLAVAPYRHTLTDKFASFESSPQSSWEQYSALPQQNDNACVMLSAPEYAYDWSLEYGRYAGNSWRRSSNSADKIDNYARFNPDANASDTQNVVAVGETERSRSVHVVAQTEVSGQSYSGYGDLTINFADFTIEDYWPSCPSACNTAAIGARFSEPVDRTTLAEQVHLMKCSNSSGSSCTTPISNSFTLNEDGTVLTVDYDQKLDPTSTYRVIFGHLSNDTNAIRDTNGQPISGPDKLKLGTNRYSWTFSTKGTACTIATTEMSPANACVGLVGASQSYSVLPRSAPDSSCDASGQLLNGNLYDWDWWPSSENSNTAYNAAVGMFSSSQTKERGSNAITAHGQGAVQNASDNDPTNDKQVTDVNVQETGTSAFRGDAGEFCLQCGFVRDEQCVDGSGNAVNETYGVGSNTCCFPRPQVTTPDESELICRNALLEAAFDRRMDITSFANNAVVAANYESEACPSGTRYLELALAEQQDTHWWQRALRPVKNAAFAINQWGPVRWTRTQLSRVPVVRGFFHLPVGLAQGSGDNWCAVPGQIDGYTPATGESVLTFTPSALLPAGKGHVLLIAGDKDIRDGEKQGVRSGDGVTLRGSTVDNGGVVSYCGENKECTFNGQDFHGRRIDFTTLGTDAPHEGVCPIDRVAIDPAAWRFSTNRNDPRDDDENDENNFDSVITDNDKAFYAGVMSANGQKLASIANVYSWQWRWHSDLPQLVDVQESDKEWAEGNDTTVAKTTSNENGTTYLHAAAQIESSIAGIPDETKSAQARVEVFICQNPWPVFNPNAPEEWPFIDETYNFSLAYCRDRGTNFLNDDLPALSNGEEVQLDTQYICAPGADNAGASCTPKGNQCMEEGKVNNGLCVPEILREYLFTYADKPPAPKLMIHKNPKMDWSGFDDETQGKFQKYANFFQANPDSYPLSGNGAITIGWTLFNDDAGTDNYQVYIDSGGGWLPVPQDSLSDVTCGTGGQPSSSWASGCSAIVNVKNGQEYRLAVTVKGKGNIIDDDADRYDFESDFSNIITFTPQQTEVNAPDRLTATISGTDVTLHWRNTSGGVPRHTVFFGTSVNNNGNVTQSSRDAGTNTSYTVTGLQRGRIYYFQVQAEALNGDDTARSEYIAVRVGEPMGYWKLNDGVINPEIGNGDVLRNDGFTGTGDMQLVFRSLLAPNGADLWQGGFLQFWLNSSGRPTTWAVNDNYPSSLVASANTGGFTQAAWITIKDLPEEYYAILGYGDVGERIPSLYVGHIKHGDQASSDVEKLVYLNGAVATKNKNGVCGFRTEDLQGRLTVGDWHHVAAVYDKAQYTVYLDGVRIGSYNLVPQSSHNTNTNCAYDNLLYNNANGLSIGRVGSANPRYFNGSIAEVMLYNYVVTPAQVQALYNQQKPRFGL